LSKYGRRVTLVEDYETIYRQDPISKQWFAATKTGKCDYEACGSQCCLFLFVENISRITSDKKKIDSRVYYWSATGRAEAVNVNGYLKALAHHRCKQLNDDGTCAIYKERPAECYQWPTINDDMHAYLADKCTIKITNIRQVPKYKVPQEYKE